MLIKQAITAHLDKVILQYENHHQKPIKNFKTLQHIFDITTPNIEWLCSKDKELQKKQIE